MKLTRQELQKLYEEIDAATDVEKDAYGHVIAFSYKRYYGNGKKSSRVIRVTLKKEPNAAEYLDEKAFFGQLYEHAEAATDIRVNAGKITRYTLDGKAYMTDERDVPKLFKEFEYSDFLQITRARFYGIDTRLRNGYFSGLLGTSNAGIDAYKKHKQDYILYDVDFNSAYPACLSLPLPTGRFYTPEEWEEVPEKKKRSYMKFYDIRIKCTKNAFGVFVPPPPFVEYADFDFLLQKTSSYMVVSQTRKDLIDAVYGKDTYIVYGVYYVQTRVYLKLWRFAKDLYDRIQAAKRDGNEDLRARLKVALNSLIGNFGRRDEEKRATGVERVDSGIFSDGLRLKWSAVEHKEKPNYLPLAMAVNDLTALRLFQLLTDKSIVRLCYNTDGGVIALPRGYRVITSKKIGWLKATEIISARFYECSILYARPLIYDDTADRIYNTNCVFFDKNAKQFIKTETYELNTGHGFEVFESNSPLPVKPWKYFNLRASEVVIRLQDNAIYKKMKRLAKKPNENEDGAAAVLKWEIDNAVLIDAAQDFERLTRPFDADINEIRHAPPRVEHYEQLDIWNANFFKKCNKNA